MKTYPRLKKIGTLAALMSVVTSPTLFAEQLDVEKDSLKFGFIKLTDCAPIVIAKEKGFFDDEGLQVDVVAAQLENTSR